MEYQCWWIGDSNRRWDSSIGIVTRLQDGWSGVQFLAEARTKTDPEDYSITILHIIWNYLPNDTAAHPDNVTKTKSVIQLYIRHDYYHDNVSVFKFCNFCLLPFYNKHGVQSVPKYIFHMPSLLLSICSPPDCFNYCIMNVDSCDMNPSWKRKLAWNFCMHL
jgi:hypothetical protein